jgi:hypothetical protein
MSVLPPACTGPAAVIAPLMNMFGLSSRRMRFVRARA